MDEQQWNDVRARAGQPPIKPSEPKKRKPIFAIIIVAVNLLFLWWLLSLGGDISTACEGETGEALEACEAGSAIGGGIAFLFVIFLWAMVDIILGVLFMVTRRRNHQ